MEITAKTAADLRLTEEEFGMIREILGRTPNFTELCCYSAMWSEHCSYKNSIKWLKTLPRESSRMLVKAGEENAGLMDIGDGFGVVFKIESHNHPSAIEPFQGAATGVGGIHRDIFTMGARPIAALNSLRFGLPESDKTRHLLRGVVSGIGHYGNCFGVPTVGGEVYFDACYHTNPLVNAMSAGIVEKGRTVSAIASGAGNPVYYVGSATGKDGIGGASFASANITEDSAEDLPAVQVGDPFQEKKLLEACLEVIATGAVVGMQDMGAAGIICSTAEMSAKGQSGMQIDLEKVPVRQQNMKAWELLLSESQERMLMVVEKGKEHLVQAVFEKWDLPCSEIGTVTTTGLLEFRLHGHPEAVVPAESLVLGGGAPQYDRESREPEYFKQIAAFRPEHIPVPDDLREVAGKLMSLPVIASKKWIAEQYDSMVGAGTLTTNHACDAAVVLARPTGKALALTTDCNSRYVFADPYKGAMIAVAEAARNLVCSGASPLGITNCLNFGNPYNPEVYFQFTRAVQGMGLACRKFDTPVTGGNVSFYNENPEGPVYPTPTIGMVGLIEHPENIMTLDFKNAGDRIYLIGTSRNDIGCSEYLARIHGVAYSPAPYFNLDEEYGIQCAVASLIEKKLICSAHDVSEGGLFVTLAESAFPNALGFDIRLPETLRPDSFLFGEAQGRIVVSVSMEMEKEMLAALDLMCTSHEFLGTVSDGGFRIGGADWGMVEEWKATYERSLESLMQ